MLLDTDVLVCAPFAPLFVNAEWDVALTWRDYKPMRYNTGVCFSRNSGFWRAVRVMMEREPQYKAFVTEQLAVEKEARRGAWKVHELPCSEWNATPNTHNEVREPHCKVLHLKGASRKGWHESMFERGIWR